VIIRHKRFLDVCFEVELVYYSTGQIMGKWLNMGFVESWYLKRGSIFLSDAREWEKCLEPDAKCLRYAKWGPL